MLGFFPRTRRRTAPLAARSRLVVERLESRDCPSTSGVSIGSFSALPLSGQAVLLSGQVSDPNPATVVVTFGGVMSGSVHPDANGNFSYQANATALGTVTAVAQDDQGLTSALGSAAVTTSSPTLSLQVTQGQGRNVVLSGHVTDETPLGLVITFTGTVSGSAVVAADGSFTVTLQASGVGSIHASFTDAWGLTASDDEAVAPAPPAITSFGCQQLLGNTWLFSGTVADESPGGLQVTLGGLISASATVQDNGSFSVTVTLPSGPSAEVTAQVTDWYGLQSALVWCTVPDR